MQRRTIRRMHYGSSFLFSFIMIAGGVADLIPVPSNVAIFIHLGYPLYVLAMIGVAKLLGALAILYGRPLALTEWAYAGFTFDLVGALISHAVMGDRPQLIFLTASCFSRVVMTPSDSTTVPPAWVRRLRSTYRLSLGASVNAWCLSPNLPRRNRPTLVQASRIRRARARCHVSLRRRSRASRLTPCSASTSDVCATTRTSTAKAAPSVWCNE